MSKLTNILRAFLGDADAALSLVGDALCRAVVTMAQHGTRAPVDEAFKMLDSLAGKNAKEKALRAGADAVAPLVQAIKAGKESPEAAQAHGSAVAMAFVQAAAESLTAPRVTYKRDAADVAASAGKALAKLTDAQVSAFLRTQEGADMAKRIECLALAIKATDAAKEAARKEAAKPAKVAPVVTLPAAAPAVAPVAQAA